MEVKKGMHTEAWLKRRSLVDKAEQAHLAAILLLKDKDRALNNIRVATTVILTDLLFRLTG